MIDRVFGPHDRTALRGAVLLFLLLFLLCSAFSIALTQIGYFTALTLWALGMILARRWSVPRLPLDWFFAAYAAAEALATIFARDPLWSLLYLQRRLLILPIVYVLAGNIRSVRELQALFTAMVLSAGGVAVWSLGQVAAHLPEFLHFQKRLGEFQIYMTAGGLQMMGLLLLLPFLLHRSTPTRQRALVAVALVPLLTNLYFTFTRSAWLGFVAGTLLIAVYRSKKLAAALLLLTAAVVLLSPPEIRERRLLSIVDPTHPDNATRLHMWRAGWRAFLDHPLLGIGDIGTEVIWKEYAEPGWTPEGHMHNNLMQWLVTVGLLGTAALVALFVQAWRSVARIERRLRGDWFAGSLALGALAVMAGFHVNGLFEWNFGDAEIIMVVWATLGLVYAADRVMPAPAHASDG